MDLTSLIAALKDYLENRDLRDRIARLEEDVASLATQGIGAHALYSKKHPEDIIETRL